MRFRLLGQLHAGTDGADLTPSAPKERQVLALLLLNANEIVQKDQIARELWDEHRPASAMTTVQTYVYHLRRQLDALRPDDGRPLVRTRQSGYSMVVEDGDLDVGRFERAVASGVQAARESRWGQAAELLDAATTLWRGSALAGVTVGPILELRLAELQETYMEAVEFRIMAGMELGRHRELIGELRMLAGSHPFHETLHAQLVVALSRSGRRDEALQVHSRLVHRLRDELGLEPSRDLQRLRCDLLR